MLSLHIFRSGFFILFCTTRVTISYQNCIHSNSTLTRETLQVLFNVTLQLQPLEIWTDIHSYIQKINLSNVSYVAIVQDSMEL